MPQLRIKVMTNDNFMLNWSRYKINSLSTQKNFCVVNKSRRIDKMGREYGTHGAELKWIQGFGGKM